MSDATLGMIVLALIPVYVVLQIWLGFAWHGGWRVAALVPLIVVLPALALTVYATWRGSNVAPIPFIMVSPPSLIYLLVVWVVRQLTKMSAA